MEDILGRNELGRPTFLVNEALVTDATLCHDCPSTIGLKLLSPPSALSQAQNKSIKLGAHCTASKYAARD